MPPCPNCQHEVEQPQKVWSVASELRAQGSFTEKKIALYVCGRCQTKFPIVAGSKRFRIIHEAELALLKKKAAEAAVLSERVKEMELQIQGLTAQLDGLSKALELERLRGRRDGLSSEVEYLREVKKGYQREISELQGEGLRS